MGLDTKTYWLTDWLTDWPSVAMWRWLWLRLPTLMWPRVEKGVVRKHQLKKKSNPSIFIKGGTTKGEKNLDIEQIQYMAMGPSGARCQEWPCWLVAGSKLLLCSALLILVQSAVKCSVVKSSEEFLVEFWGSMVIELEMARRLHSGLKC
jgi:hypothetical protein